MPHLLSDSELKTALGELPGWEVGSDGKAITRVFQFKTFSEAFGFMSRVALAAEKLDHHPDWSNSYNRVAVSLSTHSAKGVTELDIKLAKRINISAGIVNQINAV